MEFFVVPSYLEMSRCQEYESLWFDTNFSMKFLVRMMMWIMLYANPENDSYTIVRVRRFLGSNIIYQFHKDLNEAVDDRGEKCSDFSFRELFCCIMTNILIERSITKSNFEEQSLNIWWTGC